MLTYNPEHKHSDFFLLVCFFHCVIFILDTEEVSMVHPVYHYKMYFSLGTNKISYSSHLTILWGKSLKLISSSLLFLSCFVAKSLHLLNSVTAQLFPFVTLPDAVGFIK